MTAALSVTERDGAVRFTAHVKPRSSRSRIEGVREDGALIIALHSPPVDGAANKELIRLVAATLGVKKAAVSIASGHHGRRKIVEVTGVTTDAIREVAGAR